MKRNLLIVSLLTIIITTGCKSEKKKFTLIGKWQLVETLNNDGGGHIYHEKISNGRTFDFKENGKIINESGQIGRYQIEKLDSYSSFLHISFPKGNEEYFSFTVEKNDPEKLILNPNNSKHQNLCDEQCTEIYVKE
jgi:hypothetical protein